MGKDVRTKISIVIALGSLALSLYQYLFIIKPRFLPKPYLVIILSKRESPARLAILAQNISDGAAYDLSIYLRFPEGSKIVSVEKGHFEIKEGGEGEHFAKFVRDQVPPHTTLPFVCLIAEKEGTFVLPEESFAECREIRNIPIHRLFTP